MRGRIAARGAAGTRASRDLLYTPTLHAGEQAHRPDAPSGAPRDSAPAAVYVVFGPALKKLWKQKFKLVMALPTCRYGSKVLGNLGGFIRNNTTKFGGIQNET